MASVRAKFRCTTRTQTLGYNGEQRIFNFMPMYEPDRPEDQRYAKATPSGKLELTVDNPAVEFEVGKDYYLDFTPVDAA